MMQQQTVVMGGVGVGDGEAVAPSLVQREALGKNNFPRRKRKAYRPCPKLPGRRIRLQSDANPALTCLLKCKGWCCTGCGPWMKDRFIKVASAEAKRVFKVGRFLTLTLPPEARNLELRDQWKESSRIWKKFVARVERLPTHYVVCKKDRLGAGCDKPCKQKHVPVMRRLTAIWVREAHLDGVPHLHVLVDRFMPQAWVSKTWQECGGGRVVDIRQVKIAQAVAYITKYLAKSLGKKLPEMWTDGLKGIRRYGTTGDAKLKGVYPVKKGTDPWRIWYKPGLETPRDWRPAPPGGNGHVIAWVSMHFGEGRISHSFTVKMANAIRERSARLRADQAKQQQFVEHVEMSEFDLQRHANFWAQRREEQHFWGY